MPKNGSHPLVDWADGLEPLLGWDQEALATLSQNQAGKVRVTVARAISRLATLAEALDPVRLPGRVFNPSDPALVGPFIGLGLLAQPRMPLAAVGKFYGSGVYAIYYRGDFPAYAPLSGAEHPIYVGKADPVDPKADSPLGQGPKLSARLAEHARSIGKAGNLRIEDFECRFLVISSGWQESAETFLIRLYEPVWNTETNICFGLGKHGDAAETRANKRSPWDTMHPGREWAAKSLEDQLPESEILRRLDEHFKAKPPLGTIDQAVQEFFDSLR